jgi:hypothetical protein
MRLRLEGIHWAIRILVRMRSGRQLWFAGGELPQAAKARAVCVRYRPGVVTYQRPMEDVP